MAFYFRNCNPLPRTVLYLEHFPTINNSWDTGTVQFSIGFLILCIDVVVANSIKFESVNYCQIHYNYPGGIASCIVTYLNIPPVTMMMVFIYLFLFFSAAVPGIILIPDTVVVKGLFYIGGLSRLLIHSSNRSSRAL